MDVTWWKWKNIPKNVSLNCSSSSIGCVFLSLCSCLCGDCEVIPSFFDNWWYIRSQSKKPTCNSACWEKRWWWREVDLSNTILQTKGSYSVNPTERNSRNVPRNQFHQLCLFLLCKSETRLSSWSWNNCVWFDIF